MKIVLSVLSILLISCSIAWDRDSSDVNRSRLFNNGWKFIRDSVAGAEEVSLWGWQLKLPAWNWQGNEGKTLQVRVFTKAPKVRLELNGKTLGEKTLQEADKYAVTFQVPYEAGKLTAVAICSDGREQGRRSLTTTGEATAIKLTVDRTSITPDRNDLAFCKIEAIDAAGQLVPTDSSMVEITVSGAGELIASGNADPDGIGSANKARLNLFRGRAQAIIRPFEEQGTIIITVKSDDLKPAVLEIKCGR